MRHIVIGLVVVLVLVAAASADHIKDNKKAEIAYDGPRHLRRVVFSATRTVSNKENNQNDETSLLQQAPTHETLHQQRATAVQVTPIVARVALLQEQEATKKGPVSLLDELDHMYDQGRVAQKVYANLADTTNQQVIAQAKAREQAALSDTSWDKPIDTATDECISDCCRPECGDIAIVRNINRYHDWRRKPRFGDPQHDPDHIRVA